MSDLNEIKKMLSTLNDGVNKILNHGSIIEKQQKMMSEREVLINEAFNVLLNKQPENSLKMKKLIEILTSIIENINAIESNQNTLKTELSTKTVLQNEMIKEITSLKKDLMNGLAPAKQIINDFKTNSNQIFHMNSLLNILNMNFDEYKKEILEEMISIRSEFNEIKTFIHEVLEIRILETFSKAMEGSDDETIINPDSSSTVMPVQTVIKDEKVSSTGIENKNPELAAADEVKNGQEVNNPDPVKEQSKSNEKDDSVKDD